MPRRLRSPKRHYLPIPGLQQLLDAAGRSPEVRNTLRAMLQIRKAPGTAWRGQKVIPPGSFADVVTDAFRPSTDIPLELPLAAVMTLISGRLLQAGCRIDLHGQKVKPTLWTVALAPSGAGKTYATAHSGDRQSTRPVPRASIGREIRARSRRTQQRDLDSR
ncbi:hypothetical protein [Parvibaculum sp.]|uniref:hypothetical protein n=1 Tax=Parvibaculum sp. TaxID=2024848 RepID=UPI0025FCBC7A|nr:hypothetical protein [Parvibaculum sp.]